MRSRGALTMTSSFPNIYEMIPTEELLRVFAEGPRRLREVLSGLEEAQLRSHPVPRKWSILEIVLHLADSEIMGAARFRLALAEPEVAAPAYDQDRWSVGLSYDEAPYVAFVEALDLFTHLTRTTHRLLERAAPEAWQQWVRHGEWGRMTLRQLLDLYADHRERHIEQILERRALLGAPIEFPILLKRRLY